MTMQIHVVAVMRIGALLTIMGMLVPWVTTSQATLSGIDIAGGSLMWHQPDLYLVILCAAVLVSAGLIMRANIVRWLSVGMSLLPFCLCAAFLAQGRAVPMGDGYISLFDGAAGFHLGPGSIVSVVGCLIMIAGMVLVSEGVRQRHIVEDFI